MKTIAVLACLAALARAADAAAQQPGDWPAYGHDPGGSRYSPLARITRANVRDLRVAWVYRTGDLLQGRSRFEATPLEVDGTLYLATPLGTVIALDAARGTERWRYNPQLDLKGDYGDFANRGVSTWVDARRAAGAPCRRRIFVATVDARLIALDAATGTACADFGTRGTVALTRDLFNAPEYVGEYEVTSPPAVVGDVVVVGSSVADNHRSNAPNGVVRAYDARTGKERWSWDPIARAPGAPGAANAWSVLSAEPRRDLVFVPVGSASPDYYGGARPGDNRWANSVVALRASTGRFVWGFQVVHHDLWDYDVPAQPVVFTLRRGNERIPAVAVATKMGHLFILDRLTGKPLFPVEERPVPPSDVPGEETWPTQPFPADPFRLVPEAFAAADAFGGTPEAKEQCKALIASLRAGPIFTPPSLQGTVVFPGDLGGSNWSGVAIDERRGLIVAPTNRLAMMVTLVPRDQLHAAHMAHPDVEVGRMNGTPYGMLRDVLRIHDLQLCTPPPWGTLEALDLEAEPHVRWQTPLGSTTWLTGVPGSQAWGSVNLGGAMITAGGLVFVAGTLDQRLRAFDEETGAELWSAPLPVNAHALPMTYLADGRQYVVIAAGGHDRLPSPKGDYVMAFTLPGPGRLDTATYRAAGVFTGEMRSGGDRHVTTLTLRAQGDSLGGTIEFTVPAASGTLSGHQAGDTVWLTGPFHSPERRCDGALALRGELANGGRLLDGWLMFTGPCSTGTPPDSGAFGLWRK